MLSMLSVGLRSVSPGGTGFPTMSAINHGKENIQIYPASPSVAFRLLTCLLRE